MQFTNGVSTDTQHTEHKSPSDIEEKVEQLLARMTLQEKIGQLIQVGQHWRAPADADAPRASIEAYIRAGQIGSILSIRDVKAINRLQKIAVEESRLGIPLIIGNDVIHGYRTIFPIPLAESCTWDPDLLEHTAHIAAEEAAASGTDWIFAPMVDICRDPRWGRIAEGAGEDPMLGQAMARARVRGFQALDLPSGRKIVACPKHYVAYGGAEAGKDYNTVDVSERTLRDVYLPPFKAAFDAGAGTVMSAFNEINGIPASANSFTLRTILREEWGFMGVILSDYDAIGELIPHGFAADLQEAAYKSIMAGIDMDMMSNAFFEHLADLVREEKVPQMIVDDAVRRVLRLKIELGLFEHPYTDETLAEAVILREDYREVALEVAQKSMILLKNEGNLLPLSPALTSIAVIGPLVDDRQAPLGCWACEGHPEDVETVLEGLKAVKSDNVVLTYEKGCGIQDEAPLTGDAKHRFEKAIAVAREADVVIMVLGESAAMSGEAHSRAYLGLPGQQQALLEAIYATDTPIVAVLMSGRPLVIPWIAEHVPAIVQAWHGGIRTGRAVADILFGHVNPSGKLTASFPRTEGQIPVYYAHKSTGRPVEGPGTMQFNQAHKSQYLDEVNAPQFAFGYGLSYTTYSYSDLQVETPVLGADKNSPLGKTLVVTAVVQNTGDRAGDEIVQLYTRDLVGSVTRPVKELKGFQRISLAAGERARIRFEVPVRQLGFHGLDMHYRVEPGKFKVWIGPNSTEGLEGEFEVRA
jgi:beta-glucosidase